jgi:hypothetical protein
MIKKTPLNTAEDYKVLVEQLSFLVDEEFKKFENITSRDEAESAALSAPKLISLVNTIGYLRGQDNAFIQVRPFEVHEFQNDLYENENSFEKRLNDLINKIKKFGGADTYNRRLREYFCETRGIKSKE